MARSSFALLLIACVCLASCASTSLTTFRDPEFTSNQYRRPVIYAQIEDLEWCQAYEQSLVNELRRRGITAASALEVAPPTRPEDERASIILSSGYDAVLLVTMEDAGNSITHVPQTTSTTTFSGNTATTTNYGGYNISKPWNRIAISLVDAQSGKVAWIAHTKSHGNGFASSVDLKRSFCRRVASQLLREQILISGAEANRADEDN